MLLELEGGVVSAALHHGYITSASVEEEGGRLQSSRLSLTLMNGFITSDRAEPGRTNRERPRGGCLGRSLLSFFYRLEDRLQLVSVSAVLIRTLSLWR